MKKLNQILLVDDDDITNYLNQKLIQRSGLTDDIHVALNGLEALQMLKKKLFCTAKLSRIY